MNRIFKGILAGIGATLVMSLFIMIKNQMGLFPGIDAIQVFTNISANYFGTAADPVYGWVWFSIVAGVVWGSLFSGLEGFWPGKTDLTEALSFSVIVWLVAMLVFMPMAGFGFFAMGFSGQAPFLALLGHLIYGALLGVFYAWLQKESPLDIEGPHMRHMH